MRLPALLAAALVLAGCSAGGPADAPTTPTTEPDRRPPEHARGVALSPRSYASGDFSAFFDEARAVGEVVLWGGPPEQLADASAAPHVVAALARQKGLAVAIQVSYVTEAGEKPFGEVTRRGGATRPSPSPPGTAPSTSRWAWRWTASSMGARRSSGTTRPGSTRRTTP